MSAVIGSGNFWLSPALANGDRDTGTEIPLQPNPTYVDYGQRLVFSIQESQAKLIKQLSTVNPKEKKWVWVNYRADVPKYEPQYKVLFNHQEHIRHEVASGSPYVYLKEDVTGLLGYYDTAQQEMVNDWVRCRILIVDRGIRKEGGYATYPETELIFTVDDPSLPITY